MVWLKGKKYFRFYQARQDSSGKIPAHGLCKMLVFVWSLSGVLPVFYQSLSRTMCWDFTRQIPAHLIELKMLLIGLSFVLFDSHSI